MKNCILIFSIFFLVASCGNSVVPKPNKLIDDDVMVNILYDLALFDAIRNNNSSENGYTRDQYVFKKYKIDSLQFAQNNRYYSANVAKYKRMYNKVNQRLTDNDAALTELMKKNSEKLAAPIMPTENGQIK